MFCNNDNQTLSQVSQKVRAPVFFNITEVSPTSEVTLTFSEKLFSLNEFDLLNLNKTIFNQFRKQIINIYYITELEEDIRPKLVDW